MTDAGGAPTLPASVTSAWFLKSADKKRSPEAATSRSSSIARWQRLEEATERQFGT